MSTVSFKLLPLRIALVVFGLFFIFGLYLCMNYLPPSWGWSWEPRQLEYEQMIQGIYATLGVFLLLASRNPMEHRSLILFTIWSSIVHGAIMLIQALKNTEEHVHFYGDVPALLLAALILAALMPKKIDQGLPPLTK